MQTDVPNLSPLEDPGLPPGFLCGGLKRHYRAGPASLHWESPSESSEPEAKTSSDKSPTLPAP